MREKALFHAFCHVACNVLKMLCLRLWRPMFCSVYLMYTADAKYFNGLGYLLGHRELLYCVCGYDQQLEMNKCCKFLFKNIRLKCIAEISIFVCSRVSESGHIQSPAPGIPRDLGVVGSSSPQFRYNACLSAMYHTGSLWAMSIKCGFAFS